MVRWDAARGFGFIRSGQVTGDVFFHKRDFRGKELPREGLQVSFEDIHVGGKGPRAMAVQPLSAIASSGPARPMPGARLPKQNRRPQTNATAAPASSPLFFLMLLAAWIAVLGWGIAANRLPLVAGPIALIWNLLTFFAYWLDKYAAQQGQWRTSEQTLHILELLGGWPGAWMAQRLLRHKSNKASFLATYRATVFLHFTALSVWVFLPEMQNTLSNP